jgi:hypothetical protein
MAVTVGRAVTVAEGVNVGAGTAVSTPALPLSGAGVGEETGLQAAKQRSRQKITRDFITAPFFLIVLLRRFIFLTEGTRFLFDSPIFNVYFRVAQSKPFHGSRSDIRLRPGSLWA